MLYIVKDKQTGEERYRIEADNKDDLMQNWDISEQYFDIEEAEKTNE